MFNSFIEKTILIIVATLIFTTAYFTVPKSVVAYNSKNLKTVNEAVQENSFRVIKQNLQ